MNMETTIGFRVQGLGLYKENGKENGNYGDDIGLHAPASTTFKVPPHPPVACGLGCVL